MANGLFHSIILFMLPVFAGAYGSFFVPISFVCSFQLMCFLLIESTSIAPNGRSLGIYETGIIVYDFLFHFLFLFCKKSYLIWNCFDFFKSYTSVIIVVTMKLALESSYWNWSNKPKQQKKNEYFLILLFFFHNISQSSCHLGFFICIVFPFSITLFVVWRCWHVRQNDFV